MKPLFIASVAALLSAGAHAQLLTKPGTPASTQLASNAPAQFLPNAVITEGFDTVAGAAGSPLCTLAANLTTSGWFAKNNAVPAGTTCVFNGGAGTTPPAQSGAATSYAAMNFNSSTGAGDISTWFVTPRVNFGTGARLEFWTRGVTGNTFPDSMQVRLSTAADAGTPDVGATTTSVGTFTTLLLDINPTLAAASATCAPGVAGGLAFTAANSTITGYPLADWCKITISGAALPSTGSGRIAFRYYPTAGGPSGANSNFIGVDTFSFDEGGAAGATVVPGTAAGAVTIPARTLPTASATATLSFTASVASSTTCVATGAGYSVSPSPLTLPAGTAASVTVTQNSAAAGTYTGTVTCTNAAGATPASFVYNFTHVVNGVPVVLIPTPVLNLWGVFALLAGLGLFGAFAVRRFS